MVQPARLLTINLLRVRPERSRYADCVRDRPRWCCPQWAPWPTLHLIREASIDRAVAAFPEAEAIYERNIETLEALGLKGWQQLFPEPKDTAK